MNSKGIAGFNVGLIKSVGNSYTPTEWATGDVITAEKLNHIEEGISDAGGDGDSLFVKVQFTWDEDFYTPIISTPFSEILEVINSGKIPYLCNEYEDFGMQNRIIYYYNSNDGQSISFYFCNTDEVDIILLVSDDSCNHYIKKLLPEIQNGDAGKVLTVSPYLEAVWTQPAQS